MNNETTQKSWMRRHPVWSTIGIFFLLAFIGSFAEPKPPIVANNVEEAKTEVVATSTPTPKPQPVKTVVVKQEQPKVVQPVATTPTPAPTQDTSRAEMLVILKANASTKWGDNYQMVKYEYDNQVADYDWVMAQTKYPNIMAKARQKWGNNFQMVKYEYTNQVEAYESL